MAKVIFLKTTGSLLQWTVPQDWNSLNNSIECIGGGGGGGGNGRGGGGGGAYAKITNLVLTPGASVSYRVGAKGLGGGASGSHGGDTWFNGTDMSNCSVGAKGGQAGPSDEGGPGGSASASVGSVKFSGGTGGESTP
ncbi:MAG TPA: hypothetical protein VNK52_16035, partial [Hyphomicrobiaceae bacterium]|nr:hypothetical protein [Hyphomicrobiaceae bacterium]